MPERDPAGTFSAIYQTDHWSGGSGQGSTIDSTQPYRRVLHLLLRSSDIASVVDVGCGDWQFSRTVRWGGVHYVGLDVVRELITQNQRRFGSSTVDFRVYDVLHDEVPRADLIIVKDVLQHWPNEDVARFLARLPRLCKYALITNDVASEHWPHEVNRDIALGAWRTLDLEQPPFALHPLWRGDYDIGAGEWTKRMYVVGARWRTALPRSAALRLRAYGGRLLAAAG